MCVNRWTSPLPSIQERAQPEYSERNKPHTCGINMCALPSMQEGTQPKYSERNKGLKSGGKHCQGVQRAQQRSQRVRENIAKYIYIYIS